VFSRLCGHTLDECRAIVATIAATMQLASATKRTRLINGLSSYAEPDERSQIMVASQNTIEQILRVVLQHVSRPAAFDIITDLKKVDGNKSFKDTITRLEALIEAGDRS
jgi:uncharacterized heparinase superfamily protein